MLVAAVVARNPKSEIVRASYSENGIGENARPHPGPLPQERTPRTLNAHCTLEPPEAPSPGLRPPSPPVGERDGVRGIMGRGKHAQFSEFSRPLVWSCFMGTHVGCYEGRSSHPRLTIPACRPFCSPPFSFASVWPLPIKRGFTGSHFTPGRGSLH